MFTRILAIFSISLVFTETAESAPALGKASSKQFFSEIPGYIPVYIRSGETPLQDINPDLAAAFDFYAQKHGRITFARYIGDKSDNARIKSGFPVNLKSSEIDKVPLDVDQNPEEDNTVIGPEKREHDTYSHIQKITRD